MTPTFLPQPPLPEKCVLETVYLKVLGFRECGFMAVIYYFEPFQPHTIYGHSRQKTLSCGPPISQATN